MRRRSLRLIAGVGFAALLCSFSFAGAQTLGTAASFAVLANTAVTNVNNPGTIINGDLGVSPGTTITGFPPGVVNGTIYPGGSIAAQAQADVTIAYDFLAAQKCTTALTGQDLAGLILPPGVYCSATSAPVFGGNAHAQRRRDLHLSDREHDHSRQRLGGLPDKRRHGLRRLVAGRELRDSRPGGRPCRETFSRSRTSP